MQIIKTKLINGLGKTKGCEKAPVEVLKALKKVGSSEDGRIIEYDKLDLEEIHVDLFDVVKSNELIFKNSVKAFENHDKVFFIGGDHSITYSIGRGFDRVYEGGLLIIFDAHADCVKVDREPVNGEWLCKLVEGGFSGDRIILISARNIWEEELDFIKKNGITWIKMEVLKEDIKGVCDVVMERANSSDGFYVSIDMDCVDPGFAPAVTYPEPGGLSSGDLIYFIKRLRLLKNFKGADIVEINPDKDVNNITVRLGAKLLVEMI